MTIMNRRAYEDVLKENETYRIGDMAPEDRPRERLLAMGAKTLKDEELLAILLRTGSENLSSVDLARCILDSHQGEGVGFLGTATPESLKRIPGIKDAKAATILAAVELGRRVRAVNRKMLPKVTSPDVLAGLLMEELELETREVFLVASLDTKKQLIAIDEVTAGILDGTIIHPREVFQWALNRNAHTVIIAHNHPSGSSIPSMEDKQVTERLKAAGAIMGIDVIDHLVIGFEEYYSFLEHQQI